MRIGRKIWQNECGGTVAGLTSWNVGENFASLGIGHFIWYPAGARGPFEESFPPFVRYAERRGAKLPELLLGRKGESLSMEFARGISRGRVEPENEATADFSRRHDRFSGRLPGRAAARGVAENARRRARTRNAGKIEEQFNRVASSAQGCYALIDYVNFKGEGVLLTERYRGRGWGLLQVLEGMSAANDGAAADEFADPRRGVLRERVENSPPERHEQRWLPGWLNRVASYR